MYLTDIMLEGDDWTDNIRREWDKVVSSSSSNSYFNLMSTGTVTPRTTTNVFPENARGNIIACSAIYNDIQDRCEAIREKIESQITPEVKQSKQFGYIPLGEEPEEPDTTVLYFREM